MVVEVLALCHPESYTEATAGHRRTFRETTNA
jgi:hypothetical protein